MNRRWWLSRRFLVTWAVVAVAVVLAVLFSDPDQPYMYYGG